MICFVLYVSEVLSLFRVLLPKWNHISGFEQLPKSSASFKYSEEQPSNLGLCDMGAFHNVVYHGYSFARLSGIQHQGNNGKL
jgi:hypothetical protein